MQIAARAALIASLCLVACGDPVAPGDYLGESRLELEGILCGDDVPADLVQPTVGLYWKWREHDRVAETLDVVSALAPTSYPSYFTVPVYDAPPTRLPNRYATSDGSMVADFACPLVFDDRDRDGEMGPDDVLIGVSWSHLIMFVHDDVPDAEDGLSLQLEGTSAVAPGYHLVEGVCGSESKDRVRLSNADAMADIRFVQTPGVMPAPPEDRCVDFF
ncbi:MAG: hypothetical protein RMA76_00250 [Deltaproteobacteria bacterium]|jgi:hypothetical protein